MSYKTNSQYHNPPLKCNYPNCGKAFHWGRGYTTHTYFHECEIIDEYGRMVKLQVEKSLEGRLRKHNKMP